jgi:hypothetical protein
LACDEAAGMLRGGHTPSLLEQEDTGNIPKPHRLVPSPSPALGNYVIATYLRPR